MQPCVHYVTLENHVSYGMHGEQIYKNILLFTFLKISEIFLKKKP